MRSGQGGSFDNSVICLPKTGQTISYATGDDGDLETGVAWPNPRFTDIGDGTVKDELTGLVWSKNANLLNSDKTWQQALDYVAGMNAGTYPNFGYTDWRLPNVNELKSLIDNSEYGPALPSGYPFTNVRYAYWSSTTDAGYTDGAWVVSMDSGYVFSIDKSGYDGSYAWPVRGPGEPHMVIEPAGTYDFGEVPLGSSASTIVTIRNTGTAPLVIYEMYEFEFPCYSDNAPPSGYVISPGQSLEIEITFTPAYVGDGGYDCLNFMTSDGHGSICVHGKGGPPATVIALASFTADSGNGSVKLLWKTETELDNAGFNIYRSETADGKYVKLNSALIPAKGSATQGASYEFIDKDVQNMNDLLSTSWRI